MAFKRGVVARIEEVWKKETALGGIPFKEKKTLKGATLGVSVTAYVLRNRSWGLWGVTLQSWPPISNRNTAGVPLAWHVSLGEGLRHFCLQRPSVSGRRELAPSRSDPSPQCANSCEWGVGGCLGSWKTG